MKECIDEAKLKKDLYVEKDKDVCIFEFHGAMSLFLYRRDSWGIEFGIWNNERKSYDAYISLKTNEVIMGEVGGKILVKWNPKYYEMNFYHEDKDLETKRAQIYYFHVDQHIYKEIIKYVGVNIYSDDWKLNGGGFKRNCMDYYNSILENCKFCLADNDDEFYEGYH